ncbi:MAG: polysaccharide deacetylase family protein [Anaerolineales bacterium]|jgi:peptidoglycan/xylan/chitin deacetylase (PgdA/CDA1 family)
MRRRWLMGMLLGLILACAGSILMLQPRWILRQLNGYSNKVLYSVETDLPLIALTIDDGPDPETTGQILDVLAKYDASATFFILAENVPGNEGLLERMIREGHEIGNHMITDKASIHLSSSEFERRLLVARETLAAFADTTWFRPGSGWYNKSMLSILSQYGYHTVLGSIYPWDAHLPSSRFAARYILRRAFPGAVIVLHDVDARGSRTVQTLETVLPELKQGGFRIVTLTELTHAAAPLEE